MLRIAQEALTFDYVLLLPGYSDVIPSDVSLRTRLTRGIELNIPLVSAAMDTVTEARLAIALAQEGGIGIIHKSMTIAEQAEQVRRVKKFESGVVKDPITIQQNASLAELLDQFVVAEVTLLGIAQIQFQRFQRQEGQMPIGLRRCQARTTAKRQRRQA